MCSNTRGPAISPDLVTCPAKRTGILVLLAKRRNASVHSLTCVRPPALPATPLR
nr:hypothetical protein Iba_chr01fCG0100 [Ipomoea batatas]